MQRTAYFWMDVDCPHCGVETKASVEALAESGSVPREPNMCRSCKKQFWTEATLAVFCVKPNAGLSGGPDKP